MLLVLALIPVAQFAGFAGYRLNWWRASPREAWDDISNAAAAGDFGAVWDRFDTTSQERLAHELRTFAEATAPDQAAGMTDRERYILLLQTRADLRGRLLPGRVVEVKEYGDRASVRLDRPDPTDRSLLHRAHQRRLPGLARRSMVSVLPSRRAALTPPCKPE
jgi:hypothetical protein